MRESAPADVGSQTRRGISWSLLGAVVTNVVRLTVLAVLGRVLTAADFGTVAAALSVNVIVYGLKDVGVGSALVQRSQIEPAHVGTAFAVSTSLGIAFGAGLFLAAPLISALYRIPESVDVIRTLAIAFFALRGVASTSRVLCQRAMNFKMITIIDTSAFSAGSIVSIACALVGMGPWALVAGYIVEELVSALLYLWLSPAGVSFRIHKQHLRDLLNFGVAQTVIQSTNVVAVHGDNFVVGHELGAAELGFYARAYDLIRFPSMVFDAVVGNVLFPAFSRLQKDPAGLAVAFGRVVFVNAMVLLPGTALLIVLAPETIHVLMGDQWADAVLPFRILAVTILLRTNLKLGSILAQAAGGVRAVSVAYTIYMIVVVSGAMVSVRWGLAGVATSTALSITLVSLHCSYLALRASQLPMRRFASAHVPGLMLAAAVVAVAYPVRRLLLECGAPIALIFATVTVTASAVCLLLVALRLRRPSGEFEWLRDEVKRVWSRRGGRR